MKKGFMVSVAICSLLVMAACENDKTQETAAAPAEQAATQTTTQPAEQKTETAAAAEVETEEVVVEDIADAEARDVNQKSEFVSDSDQQLANDYIMELEPAMTAATPITNNLAAALKAWLNEEIDDATMREYLVSADSAFEMLENELTRVAVPDFESARLHDAISEFRSVMLGMGVDGGKSVDLFIEAIDTQNVDKIEEAYDAIAPFEDYVSRGEAVFAELQTMIDME
ncbi:hypothetical protein [Saccharibacillus sacchari]|uniref:Uncharacterized protein n=1 Tax=Saccharibacillus sacchari TaxID=456493 RepID=A0ACC6PBT3_9BACL